MIRPSLAALALAALAVASPAARAAAADETVTCKDGTYSHAKGRTGACSRHGGVAEWLDGTKK